MTTKEKAIELGRSLLTMLETEDSRDIWEALEQVAGGEKDRCNRDMFIQHLENRLQPSSEPIGNGKGDE